jgi:hypothetical protein
MCCTVFGLEALEEIAEEPRDFGEVDSSPNRSDFIQLVGGATGADLLGAADDGGISI